MRPYEVGMFKHFLYRRGLDELYIGCYRSRRWRNNPESIEKFFYTIDPKDVVMKAFYFLTNNNCGYDFWLDIDGKWQTYRVNQWDEEHAKHWTKMRGEKRRMLTQDWDSDLFWKHQNKTKMVEKIQCLLMDIDRERKAIELTNTNNFEEVVISNHAREARLKDNQISINMRSGKGRLTMSQTISTKMRNLGGFKFALLLRNNSGDVVVKFNNNSGFKVTDGKSERRPNANITISSTAFVSKIVEIIGMKEDYRLYDVQEVKIGDSYSLQILYGEHQ
jgi:hypothetical protein